MDLVSFETRAEYEWVKERLGGVQFIWTSGSSVIRGHRVHCTSGSRRGWAEYSSSGHQVAQRGSQSTLYEQVKERLGGVQFIWTSGSSVIRGHRVVHCTSGSSRGWSAYTVSGTPPPPHTQASLYLRPHPLGSGAHQVAKEGVGAPIWTTGQTLWYFRYICTLCTVYQTMLFPARPCSWASGVPIPTKSLLEPIDFGTIYISSILPNPRWKLQS